MKMDIKNMIGMVVAIAVGIIMIGPLVSVVSNAQTITGDPIVINNENYQPTADYTDRDIIMTITAANDDDGYAIYVNGVGYEKPTGTRIALISDKLIVYASSTEGRAIELRYWNDTNSNEISSNVTADVTVGYTHTTRTLTYSDGTTDLTYTEVPFVFCWDKNGQYGEVLSNTTYPDKAFRMIDIENGNWGVFDTSGVFTINEVSHRGIITASKYGVSALFAGNPEWTVKLDYGTPALKDGTTDLYDGLTPVFIITDENGNSIQEDPIRSFVLNEAKGHATSGATYDLLGIIPMLVTAGLILGIAGAIFVRRLE